MSTITKLNIPDLSAIKISRTGDITLRQAVLTRLKQLGEKVYEDTCYARHSSSLPTAYLVRLPYKPYQWGEHSHHKTTAVTPQQFLDATAHLLAPTESPIELELKADPYYKYMVEHGLGRAILDNIEAQTGFEVAYPVRDNTKYTFNSLMCWANTLQGSDFWVHHYNKVPSGGIKGKLLNYYLASLQTSHVVTPSTPSEFKEGQLFTYRKTGTKYKIRSYNTYNKTYILETASSCKTATWCKNISVPEIHKLFELCASPAISSRYPNVKHIPAFNSNVYKVGDKVIIRPDLLSGKYYKSTSDTCAAVDDMVQLAGQLATITAISRYDKSRYRLDIDPKKWNWTSGMLIPYTAVDIPRAMPFKVGDQVRLKPNLVFNGSYGHLILLPSMNFSGSKTILAITDDSFITFDPLSYSYTPEMLELSSTYSCTAPEGVSSLVIKESSGVDPIIGKISTPSKADTSSYFDSTTAGIGTITAPRTIETPTKGKPMPKSLKDNAIELVQENKSAAFTAAEIKAGQIINKQAIKLIKPKLPMMVRGYADHPAASVLLANIVALGLKQYAPTNRKLAKVSELMIAGAAFDSIEALNLDSIINDFIAGIKLPAGVTLDDE